MVLFVCAKAVLVALKTVREFLESKQGQVGRAIAIGIMSVTPTGPARAGAGSRGVLLVPGVGRATVPGAAVAGDGQAKAVVWLVGIGH